MMDVAMEVQRAIGLLSTFQKVALNKKKNRNSIDHIPLWNFAKNSQ